MKNSKSLCLLVLAVVLSFSSCKKTDPETDSFLILKEYLVDNDMDLDHVIKNADGMKFVMGAPADGDVSAKYVMDIRTKDDFDKGHIEGAVNVVFTDILTEAAKATKPILVVCYTGQTACYATSLLRLAGYTDTQALKWGMSGWNASYDKWTEKCSDIAKDHSNWTAEGAPANTEKNYPTLNTSATDGAGILAERVAAVVAGKFTTVSGEAVLNNPGEYYTNNYFSEGDYTGFGHINSAMRVQPLLLKDGSMKSLDASDKVVTYCYTGQTSAVITAYLNVLGYDAVSLTFGMNGLYNSNPQWSTNQWGGDSKPKNLPTVPTVQ